MGIYKQLILLVTLFATTIFGQYRKWPMYSLQNMPQTKFSCHDKILGGYYADPETQCQMFHVCVKVAGVGVQDFRFLCPNSTAFDQEAQICADWGDVDCEQSVLYYGSDNFDLYRLGSGFESKRAPLAEEDEATFHLQRAETSDARRTDKQTQVDQRARPDQPPNYTRTFERSTSRSFYESNPRTTTTSDYKVTQKYVTTKKPIYSKPEGNNYFSTPRHNDYNLESKQDQDELFKGSHSSNFFSNRNNGKEDDFDYVKSPETSSKRPSGRRLRIKDSQRNINNNNIIPSSTKRATTPAPITTQEPQKTKSQTLTLQTSYRAAGIQYDDQYYKPTTTASSTTTTTTTQATRAPSTTTQQVQRYSLNSTDYQTQQKIQPTTYNPGNSAFRIKVTTSKYDDLLTTTKNYNENYNNVPSRKSTTSKYDDINIPKDSYDVYRVSNRKAKPENNVAQNLGQIKNIKNSTLNNGRNQIEGERKIVQPIGFQLNNGAKKFNDFTSFDDIQKQQSRQLHKVPLNVRPLEPRRLNAALNNNQTTQGEKPEINNRNSNRFSNQQQLEPQYFRDNQQKIAFREPAPFSNTQQKDIRKLNTSQKPIVADNANNLAEFKKITAQLQTDSNRNYSPKNEFSKDFNKLSVLSQQQNIQQQQRNSPRSDNQKNINSQREFNPPQSDYQKVVNSQREFSSPQKQIFENNTPSAPQQRPIKKVFQGPKEDFSRSPQNNKQKEIPAIIDSLPRGFASRGQIKHSSNQSLTETTQRSAQINYELRNQNRNNDNYTPASGKRFSTLVPRDQYYPTTFKPTTYKKDYESNFSQKPYKNFEITSVDRPTTIAPRPTTIAPRPTTIAARPTITTVKTVRTTTTPTTTTTQVNNVISNTNEPDEDDGQYHPELYEQDFPRNQFKSKQIQPDQPQTQKPSLQRLQTQQSRPQIRPQSTSLSDVSEEDELFKTAQSLNLGAAGLNKLRSDKVKADKTTKQPSSPSAPAFYKQSYQSSTTPKVNKLAQTTESKKPFSKKPPHADEDTSYDYAYYDTLSETPQEYSEYDVISEFSKTKKKQ